MKPTLGAGLSPLGGVTGEKQPLAKKVVAH